MLLMIDDMLMIDVPIFSWEVFSSKLVWDNITCKTKKHRIHFAKHEKQKDLCKKGATKQAWKCVE